MKILIFTYAQYKYRAQWFFFFFFFLKKLHVKCEWEFLEHFFFSL